METVEIMNRSGIIALIVVLCGLALGGAYVFQHQSQTSSSAIIPTGVPTERDSELQLQTFSVDELGEPLDDTTLPTAVSRNEARVEDEDDQLDNDATFVKELKNTLQDADEPGIEQ